MLFSFAPPLPRAVVQDPKDPIARFVLHVAAWLNRIDDQGDEWQEPLPAAMVSEALALATTSTDPTIQRLALRMLLASTDTHAHEEAMHLTDAWIKAEPDNMAPALLGWQLKAGPVTKAGLDDLVQVATLPDYRNKRFEAFQYLLAALVAYSPAAAFDEALRTSTQAGFTDIGRSLLSSADAAVGSSSTAPEQHWATALHAVGMKLQNADTDRERTDARALLGWTTATPTRDDRIAPISPSPRWTDRSEDLLLAWPIPALREEAYFKLAEGEIAFRKHLDDVLAAPPTPVPSVSEHLNKSGP
jgi:hypothetical protein